MSNRISQCFAHAKADNRAVLGIFVSAGDPSAETSAAILDKLVENGADMIELGMPFSDPMADGPAIQAAGLRAIKKGMTLARTLDMAKSFRARHPDTPLVLMGYYNPIYIYGRDAFITDALAAGVDALSLLICLLKKTANYVMMPAWQVFRSSGLSPQQLLVIACLLFWKKLAVLFIMLPLQE